MHAGQAERIASNVARLRQRIESAALAHGRAGSDITLVAVTKYVDVAIARTLVQAGCRDLGESRPQELWEKAGELADLEIRWHLIGHLQRNKVARTLPVASMIHSVDSVRLAATISRLAVESDQVQDVLLEVNISGESAKQGFAPADLPGQMDALCELSGIRLCGFMGMAAQGTETEVRPQFSSLRNTAEPLRSAFSQHTDRHPLDQLSMGMSADFEWAIAEGATIVRVGSVLYEGV